MAVLKLNQRQGCLKIPYALLKFGLKHSQTCEYSAYFYIVPTHGKKFNGFTGE